MNTFLKEETRNEEAFWQDVESEKRDIDGEEAYHLGLLEDQERPILKSFLKEGWTVLPVELDSEEAFWSEWEKQWDENFPSDEEIQAEIDREKTSRNTKKHSRFIRLNNGRAKILHGRRGGENKRESARDGYKQVTIAQINLNEQMEESETTHWDYDLGWEYECVECGHPTHPWDPADDLCKNCSEKLDLGEPSSDESEVESDPSTDECVHCHRLIGEKGDHSAGLCSACVWALEEPEIDWGANEEVA